MSPLSALFARSLELLVALRPDLPGESVSVVLNPDGEPAELTLLFELNGRRHSWEGPRPTLAGHTIAVTIHPNASVSERHCKLPTLSEAERDVRA